MSTPSVQEPPLAEGVIKFKSIEEAKAKINTYARTTWRSHKPPHEHHVVLIQDVRVVAGNVCQLVLKLKPSDTEITPPLDYPLVPISDVEAQSRIEHIKQVQLQPQPQAVISPTTRTVVNTPEIKKEKVTMTTTNEKAVKAPTPYSIIRQALADGNDKETAKKKALEAFPDHDKKSITGMVHSVAAQLKRAKK